MQVLQQCAHDALEEKGVAQIGQLFGAPVAVHEDVSGAFIVHGILQTHDTVVDINDKQSDIRARFMRAYQHDSHSDDEDVLARFGEDALPWSYPAPDTGSDSDSADLAPGTEQPRQDQVLHQGGRTQAAASTDERSAGPAALSSALVQAAGSKDSTSNGAVVPTLPSNASTGTVAAGAAGSAGSIRRTPSWQHDKFTAKPTRTQFPQLSEMNHLLGADDAPVPMPPAAAELTPAAEPNAGPVLASCDDLSELSPQRSLMAPSRRASSGSLDWSPSPALHGAAPDALDEYGSFATEAPASNGMVHPHDQSVSPHAHASAHLSAEHDGHQPDAPDAADAAQEHGEVQDEQVVCLPGTVSRGILVRPDDGTRSAVKQVLLRRAPPVLLTHFNRFQHIPRGARKRQAFVAFPFHLFIHPQVAAPLALRHAAVCAAHDGTTAVRYRLKAVLCHKGPRADSGHYTCFVWRPTALVRAAAKQLQQAQPSTAPISIPIGRSSHSRSRRSAHQHASSARSASDSSIRGGQAPRTAHYMSAGSASTSPQSWMHTPNRLSTSLISRPDSELDRSEAESSVQPSLEGTWHAVSSQGKQSSSFDATGSHMQSSFAAQRSHSRHTDRAGSTDRHLAPNGSTRRSLDSERDAESVDWEELADQPASLDRADASLQLSGIDAHLRCGSMPHNNSTSSRDGSQSAGHADTSAQTGSAALQRTRISDSAAQQASDENAVQAAAEDVAYGDLLSWESMEDEGVWARCNDETVSQASWQDVAQTQAYMLLYERV